MPILAPPTLTPAGLSPDRADRPTFVARSIARDDFIKNTQIPELQLALNNVYNNATEAFNAGVQAALDASAAEVSAGQAAAAAGAPMWVSGTSYVVGNATWSPLNMRVYRCILATSGTTDPSLDVTHWSPISGGAGATGAGGDQVFVENDQVVTTNYTLGTGKNAMTAGPVLINTGIVVTIPTGAVWTIV